MNRAAADVVRLVEDYLEPSMIPDPVAARAFVVGDVRITFTGGRCFRELADCAGFSACRYAWVRKQFERTDVVAGATPDEAVVYNTGTPHGAWPDGPDLEGNRHVDRFVVSRGKITRMYVWNDSTEILLARAGWAEDGYAATEDSAEEIRAGATAR